MLTHTDRAPEEPERQMRGYLLGDLAVDGAGLDRLGVAGRRLTLTVARPGALLPYWPA